MRKVAGNRLIRANRREEGVTFIEIVISLALYAFVIVSLVGFFMTMTTAGAIGEAASTAYSLARACTEYLQSQGFTYVNGGFLTPANPCKDAPGLSNPIVVPPLGRSYMLEASATLSGSTADIIVRASWTQGRVHTRTIATQMTQAGSP